MRHVYSASYRAFLKRLVLARVKAGMNQRDVAEALGIPQSRVSRIESGERRVDVIELTAFARLYGRSLNWFVSMK